MWVCDAAHCIIQHFMLFYNQSYYCMFSPDYTRILIELLPSVHITPVMSGSHSPFPTQMAEFGPVSNISEGQVKLITIPSSIGKPPSS